VFFPEGRYKTRTLNVASNLLIQGVGANSIIDLIDDGTVASTYISLSSVSNIAIVDVAIESSNATGRTAVYGLIRGVQASNITIRGIKFGKAPSTAIHLTNCSEWDICNNYVNGTFADGFHVSRGSKHIKICQNYFENTGDDPIGVIGYIDGANNYPPCKDMVIHGNIIYGSAARGIAIYGGHNIVVESNVIENTAQSGIIASMYLSGDETRANYQITIRGNILINVDTGSGSPGGIYAGYVRGCVIESNQIDQVGAGGDGITIWAVAKDVKCIGNIINRTGSRGILAEQHLSTNSRLIQELYTDFDETGVTEADIQNVSIIGNTIRRASIDGIYVAGESANYVDNVKIANNILYQNNVSNAASKRNIFCVYVNDAQIQGNFCLPGAGALSPNVGRSSSTAIKIQDNPNFNPVGLLTPPTIPGSGTAQTNTFPYRVRIYVSGGTVNNIAINGTNTGLTSGMFELDPGEAITLTYTAAPTWTWFGL
jgi:hypothetical protein